MQKFINFDVNICFNLFSSPKETQLIGTSFMGLNNQWDFIQTLYAMTETLLEMFHRRFSSTHN